MTTIFDATASSAPMQFLAFLVIGFAVGGFFAWPRRWSSASTPLAVIAVCGAWLGGEFACLFGEAEKGGLNQFVVALMGAGALAYAWRRFHPPSRDEATDIAMPGSHA